MLQNALSLRKSAYGPPNISDEHVSCTAPATENASSQILFKCHNPFHLPRETTSDRPKVVCTRQFFALLTWTCASRHTACTFSGAWCALYILTSKCASRHNGVHFFDISTSNSAPNLVCFVHFDLEMCFAPQRHALFRHLNFQKCSEREVLLAFSLAACDFSSLTWPHGSAPAALASLLFDPPEPQIIGKTQWTATFLPVCTPGSSFFWISLLWSSFFFSALLWLCPSLLFICPYCRKFDFQTSFDNIQVYYIMWFCVFYSKLKSYIVLY